VHVVPLPGRVHRNRGLLVLIIVSSIALGVAIVRVNIGAPRASAKIVIYVLLWAAVAVLSARYLILRAVPTGHESRWIVAAPVVIAGAAMSCLANGIGSLLPHQLAWGVIGVIIAFALTFRLGQPLSASCPAWLGIYVMSCLVLQLATHGERGVIFDVGLSALALWVIWQVACSVPAEGGLMRFLDVVACVYWAITLAAIAAHYTGTAVGSMSPETVTLPWQSKLGENYKGYGAITVQGGRELSLIVFLYHLARWRFATGPRFLHVTLGLGALAAFMAGYGRVPFIGGLLAIAVLVATSRRRTSILALAIVVILGFGTLVGTGTTGGVVNLRLGTRNWDTNHVALWGQHLDLFALNPIAGVGGKPTDDQVWSAASDPLVAPNSYLQSNMVAARGSRGEGGWTSLLAQRGIIGGGIIGGLLIVAVIATFTRLPSSVCGIQDVAMLRALVPASLVFYATDTAPMAIYTLASYVIAQATMIGVVRRIRSD
jgi:hypothetical protein